MLIHQELQTDGWVTEVMHIVGQNPGVGRMIYLKEHFGPGLYLVLPSAGPAGERPLSGVLDPQALH